MRAIDTTMLTLMVDRDADLAPDLSTGSKPERARERLDHLIDTLDSERVKLQVSTPALAEVLVKAGDAGPSLIEELNSQAVFKIADFDQRAAVESAQINLKLKQSGRQSSSSKSKVKTKFDVQIIAIAKVNGADIVYSQDGDLKSLGEIAGIKVLRVEDLPLPPPTQTKMFGEETAAASPSPTGMDEDAD